MSEKQNIFGVIQRCHINATMKTGRYYVLNESNAYRTRKEWM